MHTLTGVPTKLTSAQFAKLKGWNRSYVTRLVNKGRIQRDAAGLIDVAAAEKALANGKHPGRQLEAFGNPEADASPPPAPPAGEDEADDNTEESGTGYHA